MVYEGDMFELSPQAWGWTVHQQTRAEESTGYPHRRGGGPQKLNGYANLLLLSPQAWGWTGVQQAPQQGPGRYPHRRGGGPIMFSSARHGEIVIPTGVGVDRDPAQSPGNAKALSPQAWGWTDLRLSGSHTSRRYPHRRGGGPYLGVSPRSAPIVIPTGVGVDRASNST